MLSILPLLLILLFSTTSAWSTIVEVEQLTSIKEILSDANETDLVVFDVDQTLILPDDMLLRPCAEGFLKAYIENISTTMSEERIHRISSLMLLQRSVSLINEELPKFIRQLQNRPCKVIALTAMITGRLGNIASMEDWRYSELKNFEIDFSEAFPCYHHIVFGDLRKESPMPIFKKGILCSAKNTKGEVLGAFLKRVKWQPNRVFFIDDYLPFLESVQEHMKQAGIEFVGIHYRAIDRLEDVFDKNLAMFQLNHLIQNEEWMSDVQLKQQLIVDR